MLTPEINDPNRKTELKRKEHEPHTFGVPRLNTKEVGERKLEGHKLVTETGVQSPKEPTTSAEETEEQRLARKAAEFDKDSEAWATWVDYLDQPVNVLISELADVQDSQQLATMSVVEAATKNRKTLIEAIAAEIAKRDVK